MKIKPEIGMSLQAYFEQTSGRVPPLVAKLLDESLNPAQLSPDQAAEWESYLNQSGATIPHEVSMKFKSAKVLMKPAPVGSGIIAGGTVRDVVELVGIKDISAKMLGSNNKNANVYCAIEALRSLRVFVEGEKA